jgi:hypothetical protein
MYKWYYYKLKKNSKSNLKMHQHNICTKFVK